ncbi:MAG: hypothetical protein O3B47_00495 [bacterium]|nr:hypothetical protein [bacterium]
METIKSILGYLFDKAPGKEFSYYIPMVILILVLILGGIIFSAIYKKRKRDDFAFKRLFKKTGSNLVIFGIIFILLTLIRYENIIYFSMRIWLYLSLMGLLYFLYKTIHTYKVSYPKEKRNVQTRQVHTKKEERKYLPNKKKRH